MSMHGMTMKEFAKYINIKEIQKNNLKQVIMRIIALQSCTFSKKFKVTHIKVPYK
jgi:hypothetical protein